MKTFAATRIKTAAVCAAAISLFSIFVSPVLAQPDPEFARANDEFAKGQFRDAIREYESLVQAQQWSAPLFYNLGNAYFRVSDFGRAILNYERALLLDPRHPEAAANLALAREEGRALELQRGRPDNLLKHVTANQFTIAGAIAFWLAMLALAWFLLRRRRSPVAILLGLLGFGIAFISAAVVYRVEATRKAVAIVTAPEVQARLATADTASSVLQLPPGSEIRVLSRRGDWVYALLPNNLHGWIPTASVETVRL